MLVLETPRLALRRFTQDDFDDMHAMLGDPEVMKHYPAVKTREESQAWLSAVLRNYEAEGLSFWGTTLKTTGEIVGQVGLLKHKIPEISEIEIGYLLKRKHWGQGYASEAAAACRDHAFSSLRQEKVISMIDLENDPSMRVAKRIGMTFERECFVQKFEKTIAIYSVSSQLSIRK